MEYEDKSTVDVKCVTSPNKYAICQTENSETNSRTGVFVTNYGSLFEENGEIESYDGGVSGGTNEVMTMPSLGNLFFSEIFSRGATGESIATISFNEATNTYTIVQTPSQNGVGRSYVDTCEVTLDENGKIATVTTIYKEDNETQTATYHLEGINKAAFEKEFNEIKAIYEELLAKKNGNEAVL